MALLDIPAVASTEGTAAPQTWLSSGSYGYDLELRIPGRVVSGTFTDDEDLDQLPETSVGLVRGAGQTVGAKFLYVDDLNSTAVADRVWTGQSSGAVFQPIGLPQLSHRFFVHLAPLFGDAFVIPQGGGSYTYNPTAGSGGIPAVVLSDRYKKMAPQGSAVTFLTCVEPTFQIPIWARSGTLRNRSGAEMFVRQYRPNVEANVIDTSAATFGETGIVGQMIEDQAVYTFHPGGFTPGTAWMLCATAAAASGALLEWHA